MVSLILVVTLVTAAAQVSLFESGASGSAWSPRASQAWDSTLASATLVLDRASPRQEILGFGACLTDTSAYNAMVFMQQDVRDAFVEAMWGGSGLRSSVMRMHINSPDYAVHSYNLDNTTDDFELIHFDAALAYDSQRVLPLARLALAKATSWGGTPLKLFGSPWSPPGWMKVNNDMINSGPVCLKNDTAEGSYIQTWANYIAQWVLAVEAHLNTSLWAVTPQNEPEARQAHFESCAFDVPHYVEWVGKYLGPVLAKAAPHVKILAYDHNKLDSLKFVEGLAGDPRGLVAWHGTAVHWYDYISGLGLEQLEAIHALNPNLPLLNTEACFLESLTTNWDVGFFYAVDIIGDLRHWVGGWLGWNSVLLSGDKFPESYGGPNHDNTTHFGDPILFEFNASGTQRLVFQPSYYVLGHFSRVMLPGAFVVRTEGTTASSFADFEGFRNRTLTCWNRSCPPAAGFPLLSVGFTDPVRGQAGVVVANINAAGVDFVLGDVQGDRASKSHIPGLSIQTYTFSTA